VTDVTNLIDELDGVEEQKRAAKEAIPEDKDVDPENPDE
jgi:hypothetical protein